MAVKTLVRDHIRQTIVGRLPLLGLLALLGVRPAIADAQSRRESTTRREDVTREILTVFFEQAGYAITRAATSDESHAWRFILPSDSDLADWDLLRRQFQAALDARTQSEADSSVRFVEVSNVRVTDDSLEFTLAIGGRYRCPNRWRGSSTAWRYGLEWKKSQAMVLSTDFSDSMGCP